MPERTTHEPGTPSWLDLATTDVAAAKAFYGGLFGWEFTEDRPATVAHTSRATRQPSLWPG
jgi:uncharacterized protein